MSFYHGSSQVFYINSATKVSGTDTNFSFKLSLPSNNRFDKVCLLQLSIPKSFYNFPVGENTFTLTELGVGYTVNIPYGNYNVINLCSKLSQLLTSSSGNGWVYTVSYPSPDSADTGKLTFRVTGSAGQQPSLKFSTSCYTQLGFSRNSVNTFTSGTLESVNYISLSPVNRIYVKSSMCSTNEQSILQEVLQTFPDNSFIYFQQYDIQANSKNFTNNISEVFDFSITDYFGNSISTNGLPVQLSVLCYEKNNYDEMAKQDLIIKNLERLYSIEEEKISNEKK